MHDATPDPFNLVKGRDGHTYFFKDLMADRTPNPEARPFDQMLVDGVRTVDNALMRHRQGVYQFPTNAYYDRVLAGFYTTTIPKQIRRRSHLEQLLRPHPRILLTILAFVFGIIGLVLGLAL